MRSGPKPEPPVLSVVSDDATSRGVAFASIREAGVPPKPASIEADPIADAEWDRVVALLGERKHLSAADRGVLAAYCSAYSRVEMIRKAMQPVVIEVDGRQVVRDFEMVVVNTQTGAAKANPLFGVLSGAETNMARFASLLGLTPVDRGRVKTPNEDNRRAKGNLGKFAR